MKLKWCQSTASHPALQLDSRPSRPGGQFQWKPVAIHGNWFLRSTPKCVSASCYRLSRHRWHTHSGLTAAAEAKQSASTGRPSAHYETSKQPPDNPVSHLLRLVSRPRALPLHALQVTRPRALPGDALLLRLRRNYQNCRFFRNDVSPRHGKLYFGVAVEIRSSTRMIQSPDFSRIS